MLKALFFFFVYLMDSWSTSPYWIFIFDVKYKFQFFIKKEKRFIAHFFST